MTFGLLLGANGVAGDASGVFSVALRAEGSVRIVAAPQAEKAYGQPGRTLPTVPRTDLDKRVRKHMSLVRKAPMLASLVSRVGGLRDFPR